MGFFAALLTYLVAAALLAGGMVTSVALFFSQPSDNAVAEKPRPPLVRGIDRKKATAQQPTAGSPALSAVSRTPAKPPQLKAAEPVKQLTGQQPRKNKVAKSPPAQPAREPESTTLGYSPQPRKFVFPLDPDW